VRLGQDGGSGSAKVLYGVRRGLFISVCFLAQHSDTYPISRAGREMTNQRLASATRFEMPALSLAGFEMATALSLLTALYEY
jgi:hypothetical protein